LENGDLGHLSLATVERIAAAVDVRLELLGRWRGGDGERLLNWRHSLLADSFSAAIRARHGWRVEAEISSSIYGERGVIDQLAWHEASSHLLVFELKTEFVDINEMLGTIDRKVRLARTIATARGWASHAVSVWVIAPSTRTNRRHAAQHAALLRTRLRLDGRQLRPFLRNPSEATSGLAFWTDSNPRSTRPEGGHNQARIRQPAASDSRRDGAGRRPGA
jgi:hypothetical protein